MRQNTGYFFTLIFPILLYFNNSCYSQSDTSHHPDDGKVITLLEKMPEFPGGEEAMLAYVAKNVRYPKSAKKDKVVGKVIVRFVITETGNITDINIAKSVREDLDKEAMRVVKEMPLWSPGIQDNKPVRVNFMLPINFTLRKR